MKTYIISYTLRSATKDYVDMYAAIKVNYPEWKHICEASWLIKTDDSPKEIFEKIFKHFDSGDLLFVAEITDNFVGRMTKSDWEWLKKQN